MTIDSPNSPALAELCDELARRADRTDATTLFPFEQIRLCGQAGVFEWFMDPNWGGQGWNDADVVRGYLALSCACLTTTFVITQRTGACRRIAASDNDLLKERLLPSLVAGERFATVGISHLTTSGRHLDKPMLTAETVPGGYRLNGRSPWVTGGEAADDIVLGVSLTNDNQPTGEEALLLVPASTPGVTIDEPLCLVGLTASSTGPVVLEDVFVPEENLVAGPAVAIMQSGLGSRTGGYETSTLALGLASAALEHLGEEATRRDDLLPAYESLAAEHAEILADLISTAEGRPRCSNESLRARSNSFVLRSTQATLAAAKGRGYAANSPVGRWCREAMFFLVWSCPQPVAQANLCELAGMGS